MVVGLPGTGLGGLFYILLALWMIPREALEMLKGRSNWLRWRQIGFLAAQAMLIVAALWAEAFAFGMLIDWLASLSLAADSGQRLPSSWRAGEGVAPALALLPFVLLTIILVSTAGANRLIGRQIPPPVPPQRKIEDGHNDQAA